MPPTSTTTKSSIAAIAAQPSHPTLNRVMETDCDVVNINEDVGVSQATTDEVQLVSAAKHDATAFGELYELHYQAVADYLHRRTGHRQVTEDLTSEVFMAALRGLVRYQQRGIPFRFWLLRIATNVANRWGKRQRRRIRGGLSITRAAEAYGTENTLHENTLNESVRFALQRLPVGQQTVIALHYFEDLSIDQIAVVLRTRPGTVKSRLHRGRESLRTLIQTLEE